MIRDHRNTEEEGRIASMLLVPSPASTDHLGDLLANCAQFVELLLLATHGLPLHHRKPIDIGLRALAGRLGDALQAFEEGEASARAEPADPLLALITRYQEAVKRFDACPDGEGAKEALAMSAAYRALQAAPAATTNEEARAALRLLRSHMEHSEDPRLAKSIVNAVVALLDGESEGRQ